MDLSVAQGNPDDPRAGWPADSPMDRRLAIAVGVLLAIVALGVYLTTQLDRFYDHFVWQAAAFLEGHAAIRYPVSGSATSFGNAFFQDVLPIDSSDGVPRGLIPFPPLPALFLVPFVAAWGLSADDQTIFTILAAVDVAICWWMLGGLRIQPVVRLATALFFAFGTVFWYTAQLATTWYQAHIVAVGLALLAVGLAIRADPLAQADEPGLGEREGAGAPDLAAEADSSDAAGPQPARHRFAVDRRQFVVGLLFGLAATARLSTLIAAPFFLLVGSGGSWWRRGWSAGLGAAIPVGALLAYNVAVTGQVFHPAYDHLYQLEARAYVALDYHPEWSAEDPRYLAQNLGIMFLSTPEILPERRRDTLRTIDEPLCTAAGAQRGLFDTDCPLALPRDVGMSVLLTSPAYLLMIPVLRRYGRSRLVTGAALAVLLVVLLDLMHFSQGWVQFGYRFSNDAAPFALPLVALGLERMADGTRRWAMPVAMGLIVVSIAVNAWGVVWATHLGW
ncbi:MAG: hypothetical protein K0S97_661 [Chloroflexota bacterium]|nr:hypothetical protein [Chloroflexota bacterium]